MFGYSVNTVAMIFVIACLAVRIDGHGRMIKPPSRMSAYLAGFPTPKNFEDHQMNCGGISLQWDDNKGRCGICGDPWSGPRAYERPDGSMVQGPAVITQTYQENQSIKVSIQLTQNHKGWFEFRLCDIRTSGGTEADQACLDRTLLGDDTGRTRFDSPPDHSGVFDFILVLPPGITCPQCVLQWKWKCGNNWGCDETGCGTGKGERQEEFYACADVKIESRSGSSGNPQPQPQPPQAPQPQPPQPFPGQPQPQPPQPQPQPPQPQPFPPQPQPQPPQPQPFPPQPQPQPPQPQPFPPQPQPQPPQPQPFPPQPQPQPPQPQPFPPQPQPQPPQPQPFPPQPQPQPPQPQPFPPQPQPQPPQPQPFPPQPQPQPSQPISDGRPEIPEGFSSYSEYLQNMFSTSTNNALVFTNKIRVPAGEVGRSRWAANSLREHYDRQFLREVIGYPARQQSSRGQSRPSGVPSWLNQQPVADQDSVDRLCAACHSGCRFSACGWHCSQQCRP